MSIDTAAEQTVFVAVHEDKFGTNVSVYATADLAEQARQEIAAENWEDDMDDKEMPSDPAEAADAYFDEMMKRFDPGSYYVEQHTIIGR